MQKKIKLKSNESNNELTNYQKEIPDKLIDSSKAVTWNDFAQASQFPVSNL